MKEEDAFGNVGFQFLCLTLELQSFCHGNLQLKKKVLFTSYNSVMNLNYIEFATKVNNKR
jgi:hypothetical protein